MYFASQSSDAPGQVVALKGLDVLDVEGVQVEVVQPEHGQTVVDLEAENKGLDKVGRLLQVGNVLGLLARLDLHVARLQVESEIKSPSFVLTLGGNNLKMRQHRIKNCELRSEEPSLLNTLCF